MLLSFIHYARYNAFIFVFLCLVFNQILSQPQDGWSVFGNVQVLHKHIEGGIDQKCL